MKYNPCLKWFLPLLLISYVPCFGQQVSITTGPIITLGQGESFERLADGGESGFYGIYYNSTGKDSFLNVELFGKKSLERQFSKAIKLDKERSGMEEVVAANGNLYLFRRQINKAQKSLELRYQVLSPGGKLVEGTAPVASIPALNEREVDLDFIMNESGTKLLIKASYRPAHDSVFVTDFILLKSEDMSIKWTKTINGKFFSVAAVDAFPGNGLEDNLLLDCFVDEGDNIFIAYLDYARRNVVKVAAIASSYISGISAATNSLVPAEAEFILDSNYSATSIRFYQSAKSRLVAGGFYTDQVSSDTEFNKAGFFSFSVSPEGLSDPASFRLNAPSAMLFPEEIRNGIKSPDDAGHSFSYKMDYVFSSDDALFFAGEEFEPGELEDTLSMKYNRSNSIGRDILLVKLSHNGNVEWINHVPFRSRTHRTGNRSSIPYVATAGNKHAYFFYYVHPGSSEASGNPQIVTENSDFDFKCTAMDLHSGAISFDSVLSAGSYNQGLPTLGDLTIPVAKGQLVTLLKSKSRTQFCWLATED